MTIEVISIEQQARDEKRIGAWKTCVSHTHHMRSDELDQEACHKQLIEWCEKLDVQAIGVGSPWEPVSSAHYKQYEGPDRDLYYSGQLDQQSVKDEEHIYAMLDDLNHRGCNHTHFYLDNETPKQRYGHLWWFNWHYDFPAWHDYSQDSQIQYYEQDPHCQINKITGLPHRRRCYLEIVASQRKHGALGVWAHPTSWWKDNGKFITNIATECGLHLFADGYLDGYAHMGYNAIHRPYHNLWFHLLDTGAKVPGFAETDNCHNQAKLAKHTKTFKSYMPIEGHSHVDKITAAAKAGSSFSSTGAFCELTVDQVGMGSVCKTSSDTQHQISIFAWPVPGQKELSRLELIGKQGTVLWSIDHFTGGHIQLSMPGLADAGYLVVRAYGEFDNPDNEIIQDIEHGLISNPVYLHPQGFAVSAMTTDYTLNIKDDSEWLGGKLYIEYADGSSIESANIVAGDMQRTLPASARIRLEKDDQHRQFYISMENVAIQKNLQYIWNGEFLADHPDLQPGEVPPEVFRLSELKSLMERAEYSI